MRKLGCLLLLLATLVLLTPCVVSSDDVWSDKVDCCLPSCT